MAVDFHSIDWSLVQSFLAVAEKGSLSGAATALGQSQPTLGRHIRTMEDTLGVELFQRHPRGLTLTPLGQQMRPAAEAMRASFHALALTAEAEAGTPEGTVRIACSVFAAHHVLPPVVAMLRRAEPNISIVVQPSDDSDNLLFREADIALRMYAPRQLDLVTRKIADIEMGIFAARSYLQTRARPTAFKDLLEHDVVGYDKSPLMTDVMAAMGQTVQADQFVVRTDNQTAYWELVRAGCGIGFTQSHVGWADPLVEELHLDFTVPPLPAWLTAHETVRRIPRVDRIWTLMADALPGLLASA